MTAPLLELRGISKTFPGVQALDKVDLTLRAGEIHALMGENGAGKSTLIKVLTGVYPRDEGEMRLEGVALDPSSPLEAEQAGISTVYQEVNLVPDLSVAENIMLGRQPTGRFGGIRWRAIRERAERALERLGLSIDVQRNVSSYSMAVQQMVAVARALDLDARLLILDEPTSSLDEEEVDQLFKVLRQLQGQGFSIVFITHFLDQVYQISNRITVLRNGCLVGEYPTSELPRINLIASDFTEEGRMAGRWLAEKTGGQAKIIQLECSPGAEPAIERKKGFEEIIEQHDGMEIIASQTGDFNQEKGQEVMEALMQQFGDRVTVVYAHNDNMALGAIQAVKDAGKKPGQDIIVLSIDAVRAAFDAMQAGELNCTVECNPLLGPMAFDAVETILGGGEVDQRTVVKDQLFDMEALTDEIVASRKY